LHFRAFFCFRFFEPLCSASAPARGSKLRTSPPPPHVPCSQETPLHNAAATGHLEICKVLVQVKADVAAKDHRYDPLPSVEELFVSCIFGRFFVSVFSNRRVPPLPPPAAQSCEHPPPPPHVPCSQGTPLHKAAEEGHLEICKFLVQVKADVAAKDRFDTLLHARACV